MGGGDIRGGGDDEVGGEKSGVLEKVVQDFFVFLPHFIFQIQTIS